MPKCYFRFSILAVLLSISFSANALGSSGWTTVIEILQGQGNMPIVMLASMGDAPVGCSNTGYLRFRDADTDVGKRHFSTLLTALASGKEVNITTTECSSTYAYIESIRIKY